MVRKTPVLSTEPELVGRQEKMDQLIDYFDHLEDVSTVFISGEAGVGKTRLVNEFERVINDDVRFLKGNCLSDTVEPLLALKDALRKGDMQHLIKEEPPPKVISTYLIDDSGILISKSEREKSDLDADLFAPMLETIESFAKDSLSKMDKDTENSTGLNTIGYGDYNILIRSGKRFSLAVVIDGKKNEFLIDHMREKLSEAEKKLDPWDGNTEKADKVSPIASWFTETDQFKGEYLVDDPEVKQENLFDNVLFGLKRLSNEKPVVLFIDDLQWADHTTLSLLHYLSRNIKDDRILILGTYRPEDIINKGDDDEHRFKRLKQNMSREDLYAEIRLERLSRDDSKEIISEILEEIELEDEFTDKIYDGSEGNPFFILEMLELLVDEGYIVKKEESWVLDKDIGSIDTPSRVNDVIERRIDRLTDREESILCCASVDGEKFSSDIIGEVLDIERIDLLQELNKIEKKYRLIHSFDGRYEFDHGTIREVLYDDINVELRKEYHRSLAEAYESKKSEYKKYLETIAHHFYEADDKRGVDYLIDAAEKAKDRYANEEAVSFYKKALSLADDGNVDISKKANQGLGDIYNTVGEYEKALESYKSSLESVEKDTERSKLYVSIVKNLRDMGDYQEALEYADKGLTLTSNDKKAKCELLKEKGWIFIHQGKYEDAEDVLKDSEKTAEEIRDIKEKGDVYKAFSALYYHKAEYQRSENYLKEAIDIFKEIDDAKKLSACYNNLGLIYSKIGEAKKALTFQKQSLEIEKEIGHKRNIAISLNNIGNIYKDSGDIEEGLENHKKSLKIKREIGDRYGVATSLNNIGNIYLYQGKSKKAIESQKEAMEISREIGYKEGIEISSSNLGYIYLNEDKLDKALEHYRRSLEIKKKIGRKNGMAEILSELSEVLVKKGKIEKAKGKAERAVEIAEEVDSEAAKASSKRALGMVHRELHDHDKAADLLEDSIDISENSDSKGELAKVYFEYGILLKQKGEKEEAKRYLEKALDLFKKMQMKIPMDKTKKAIEGISP